MQIIMVQRKTIIIGELEFNIYTLDEAECGGRDKANDTLSVKVEDDGNGSGSQRNLCLIFENCEWRIYYDPIITYVGGSNNGSVVMEKLWMVLLLVELPLVSWDVLVLLVLHVIVIIKTKRNVFRFIGKLTNYYYGFMLIRFK